jgi:hypothetical protein
MWFEMATWIESEGWIAGPKMKFEDLTPDRLPMAIRSVSIDDSPD